jgi:hypothetical protein
VSTVSKKHKKVHFTFRSFLRLIVFAVVVFLIISFISNQKLNSNSNKLTSLNKEKDSGSVLGKTTEISNNLYQQIPPQSRQQLENLNKSQAFIFIQDKINFIKENTNGFPQQQIKDIQKMVVKNLYENTMKNIDSK